MKRLIVIILILMMLFLTLTSCSQKNDDNAKIQIWRYKINERDAYNYYIAINEIIKNIEFYCNSNNIAYEIIEYDSNTLSYENYVIKRNVAMANGNAIILEDARSLNDIAKESADYSKIPNYANLLDVYKGKHCIPLGIGYSAFSIDNKIIKNYGIDIDNDIMNYYDYLKIIQEMKEKGAKFKFTAQTFDYIVQYYMLKNNIRYLNSDSDIVKNKEEFRLALKNTITDICDDLKLYYPNISKKDIDLILDETKPQDYRVYDEATSLLLLDYSETMRNHNYSALASWTSFYSLVDKIEGKSFVIQNRIHISPCVFVYKKVTNNKIYDVVNALLEEDALSRVVPKVNNIYSPVVDSKKIRESLEVDENWEHNGLLKTLVKNNDKENYKEILKLVNSSYDIIVKDKDKTSELAEIYFSDPDSYYSKINQLINNMILECDIMKNGQKEIDDFINKKLDDNITNFYIHNK
jgi:hypothetical protein